MAHLDTNGFALLCRIVSHRSKCFSKKSRFLAPPDTGQAKSSPRSMSRNSMVIRCNEFERASCELHSEFGVCVPASSLGCGRHGCEHCHDAHSHHSTVIATFRSLQVAQTVRNRMSETQSVQYMAVHSVQGQRGDRVCKNTVSVEDGGGWACGCHFIIALGLDSWHYCEGLAFLNR